MSTSSWVETVTTSRGRRYKVRWRENGRKMSKTFVRKTDAEMFRARKVIPAQAAGRPVEGFGISFGEFIDMVEAEFAASTASRVSVQGFHNQIKHIPEDVRRLPMSKVSPAVISQLLDARAQETSKQATVQAFRKAISKICVKATRRGYLAENPLKAVETPAARGQAPTSFAGFDGEDPDGPLDVSQVPSSVVAARMVELLSARHLDYGLVAAVAAGAGLRFGEAVALFPEHFDLEAVTLSVRGSLHEVSARFAGPAGRVYVDTPKTKAALRTVSFDPGLVDALAPLVESRPRGEPLLRSPKGSLITRNNWGRTWRQEREKLAKWCALTGEALPPDFTLHSLRHYHISHLVARGIPLPQVAQHAGHANVSVTLRVYSHWLPENRAQMARAVTGLVHPS